MNVPHPKGNHPLLLLTLAAVIAGASSVAAADETRAPKEFSLNHVNWSVHIHPDTKTIDGKVINTLTPLKEVSSIHLDCGPLDVFSVTVNGNPVKYTHVGNDLSITLPEVAKPNNKLAVTVMYTGSPTAGIYFVPAANSYPAKTPVVYTQGEMEDNRYWIPTYDYPDNKASTEGTIYVPEGWRVLSNGKLESTRDYGNEVSYHWVQDLPMSTYLISLVAGPYDVATDSTEALPVSYWVPQGLLPEGKVAFGGTQRLIDTYSQLTGYRYPWIKFAQSAVPDFMFGGMENVSAVTQTISALHPESDDVLGSSRGLVAHELAHQWFGDTVTCASWAHAWLNEGFATFMPCFIDRAFDGENSFDRTRFGIMQGATFGMRSDNRPVVYTDYKLPIDMFDGNIYPGGAARLLMLFHMLGEKPFWTAIHHYLVENQFKPVTTPIFFQAIKESTGQDLTWFMKQWFYRAGLPNIVVSWEGDNLDVVQTGDPFNVDVELWVWNSGKFKKVVVHTDSAEVKVAVPGMGGSPIITDPDHWLLGTVRSKVVIPESQIAAIYKASPYLQRSQMIFGQLSRLEVKQLRELQATEPSKTLRESLETAIASKDPSELQVELTSADPKIRQSALSTLRFGDSKLTPDQTITLRSIIAGDPVEELRDTAFVALLNKTKDEKLAEEGWNTPTWNMTRRTAALNFWKTADPDKARTLACEAIEKPDVQPVRLDAISILGELKDKTGEHRVFDDLMKVVQEGSFTGAERAMNALVEYGDPRALPAIEKLTHSNLHFMFRAADRAYARLKAKVSGSDDNSEN